MSIEKIETKTGIQWRVRCRVNGRGSKQVKKIFATKRDAEAFLLERGNQKRDMSLLDSNVKHFEETTFRAEAEHWKRVHEPIFSPGHRKRIEGVLSELLPKYGNIFRVSSDSFQSWCALLNSQKQQNRL